MNFIEREVGCERLESESRRPFIENKTLVFEPQEGGPEPLKAMSYYDGGGGFGGGGNSGGGSGPVVGTVFVISAFGALVDAGAFVFVKFFVSAASPLLAPLFGSAIILFIIAALAFMALKRS